MKNYFLQFLNFLFCFVLFSSCTNYSTKPLSINPVIILSPISGSSPTTQIQGIEKTTTGHLIRVAAQNVELTFKGYRIFQAPSEEQVQILNPNSGVNCGNLLEIPNVPIVYTMEASTNPIGVANLCVFPVDLISGYYATIRVVYFNGIGSEDGVSSSSNAVLIP